MSAIACVPAAVVPWFATRAPSSRVIISPPRLSLILMNDATTSRNVDVLERQGLAERRPDPDDARGVIVAATDDGLAEVRRRRRQLERLTRRALDGLSRDEARRVADALVQLQVLLDRPRSQRS